MLCYEYTFKISVIFASCWVLFKFLQVLTRTLDPFTGVVYAQSPTWLLTHKTKPNRVGRHQTTGGCRLVSLQILAKLRSDMCQSYRESVLRMNPFGPFVQKLCVLKLLYSHCSYRENKREGFWKEKVDKEALPQLEFLSDFFLWLTHVKTAVVCSI